MEGEGQVVVYLGTEVVVRKDRKAGGDGAGGAGRGGCELRNLKEAKVANVQSWKRGSKSCLTVVADPWKVKVRFPSWYETPTRRRARRPWEESQWLILSHTPHAN